jgi:hypothetical protein
MAYKVDDSSDLPPLPGNGMHYIPTDNSHMDKSFLDADIPTLISQLTVPEKISLLAGKDRWSCVIVLQKRADADLIGPMKLNAYKFPVSRLRMVPMVREAEASSR